MEEINKKKPQKELKSELERDGERFDDIFKSILSETADIVDKKYDEPRQSTLLTDAKLPAPVCELGSRLMEELLHPVNSDIILKVSDERFLCHKTVLRSRCEYFRAMLRDGWNESNYEEITLSNIKPIGAAAVLCFIYGASMEFPEFCPLFDVLQTADMLGVCSLISVAEHHITAKLCHSFRKPCQDCIPHFPEVLSLSNIFSMNKLQSNCLEWNAKYFNKMWPNKVFASLPLGLHRKCLESVVDSMSVDNIIHILMESDKLLSGITRVKWTKPVVSMATELMTSCIDYITHHFHKVTKNKTVLVLFRGMGWKTDVVERILNQIGDELNVQNVCNSHIAISSLMYLAEKEEWRKEIVDALTHLKKKIWCHLVSNYFAVIHTESWHHVSSDDKMNLKSKTLCQGDETRKLSKRPVLSSSLIRKVIPQTREAKINESKEKVKEKLPRNKKIQKSECGSSQNNSTSDKSNKIFCQPMSLDSVQEMYWMKQFIDVRLDPS